MGFSVMLWGAEKLVPAEYWCPYGTSTKEICHREGLWLWKEEEQLDYTNENYKSWLKFKAIVHVGIIKENCLLSLR